MVYGGARDRKGTTTNEGFVDSDYVGCLYTRKSLIGYVFTTYGIAISWKPNLQKIVALFTIETSIWL